MGNCNYSITRLVQLGSSFFFMLASQVPSPRHTRSLRSLSTSAVAAILALILAPVDASSPKTFQAATQADFLKGDVENLSIDSHGQLVLGPAIELVYETSAPSLWAVAAGSEGSLFIGSGNEGKVYRVDPQGEGSLFFDSNELQVHALVPAPNGGLYVATSPEGRIYKVDRDGTATAFFDPDEKYIWALAVDSKGNVYAGTGEKGIVYKIAPDGNGAPFYRTKATHVTALAFDKAGNLLVGTESPGKVLRVDPEGRAFVLLDSAFQEIRALHFDDKGMLYVAALSGRTSAGSAPTVSDDRGGERTSGDSGRISVPSVSAEITSVSVVEVSSGIAESASTPPDRRALKGAVYRIAPDGLWDELWTSREDSPYDITFDQNGSLIVGTGNKGKMYRLEGDPPRPTLLARASAQQVTAFYKDGRGRLYYATANPGKLFRLSSERSTRGTYDSEPRDAQMVATWGTLSWHGTTSSGSQTALYTRSGNTETPDDTWSPWSAAYASSEGSPITSPKARYLQWRAVLTGKGEGPVLTSVTAVYLQRNLRPQVRSITVHPPGIVFQKPFTSGEPELAGFQDQTTPDRKLTSAAMNSQGSSQSPSLGRRTYQKGLETMVWRAEDENGDELVYDVLYRREGETSWRVLRRGVDDPILVWDTTTVPNGTYFVKIVASDAPSNSGETALRGELDSSAFEIDNTPPVILVASVRFEGTRTIVVFDVKDDYSSVQRVEFSQDGGQRWLGVFPKDGIADSKDEHYELVIDGELGERGLTLRANDSMNNLATAHVDAPRKR
jgi:SMP-30/gluconolaconase/LRE-like protein